jgi:hypothetical protein
MTKSDLNIDRQQGIYPRKHQFHNLIKSDSSENSGKLTPDVVQKLTEKLKDLVGEDAVEEFNRSRNAQGEVCPHSEVRGVFFRNSHRSL